MKRLIILILGVFSSDILFSQEQLGLHFDNYAASSGMLLNPAAPFASANPWEVNIVSAGAFADDNYAYLDHQSVVSAIHAYSKSSIPDPQILFSQPQNVKAYSLGFIQGPSAFVMVHQFSFGIFTVARSASSAQSQNFSSAVPLDSLSYNQVYQVPAFNSTTMNWYEIGFNAGMKIIERENSSLAGAINIKFLGGMDGMYFHNNEPFNFSKIPHEELVNVDRFNAAYGYTNNFGSNNFSSSNIRINGKSAVADIGLIYTIGEKSSGNYLWKFGASVVDIGKIHFVRNASTFSLRSNTDLSASISDLENISSLDEFNSTASQIVYGNENASLNGNDFSIGLPTAITLQAERAVGNNFFVGAVVLSRVPLYEESIYRPNVLAITPRYETKFFSAMVPVEWFEYRDVHAGAAVRIGPLTVGSDNILSWMVKGKLEGSDAYVGLRIFPFANAKDNSGSARENSRVYHSSRKGRNLSCPDF